MTLRVVRSGNPEFASAPDAYCLLQWRAWKSNDFGVGRTRVARVPEL